MQKKVLIQTLGLRRYLQYHFVIAESFGAVRILARLLGFVLCQRRPGERVFQGFNYAKLSITLIMMTRLSFIYIPRM